MCFDEWELVLVFLGVWGVGFRRLGVGFSVFGCVGSWFSVCEGWF